MSTQTISGVTGRLSTRACLHAARRNAGTGGLATRVLSNNIGLGIAVLAMRLRIHPSILSLGNCGFAGLGSAPLLLSSGQPTAWSWLAMLCWPLAYAFDCADGQVARATGLKSEAGARVDVLADYLSQLLVAAAIAGVIVVHRADVPVAVVGFMCGLWLVGTFIATVRRPDAANMATGHSLLWSGWYSDLIKLTVDTGFTTLLFGVWIVAAPTTVVWPALVLTMLHAVFLVASITREVRLSLRSARSASGLELL